MDHYQYLLLMAGCLLVTLPLELVIGARVYRRPQLLLRAVAPVVVVFSVWDVVGILAGHWSYNHSFVTGVHLVLGMPLEELVFFVVVPICGLLTYEAVGIILGRTGVRGRARAEGRPDA
ncbi:lycopene cyclase domain-containing protein [Microlunatus ginsengisoli]|uniref:lycopene cyclase domain-containing protein n=1 Tax=Microlunatus ginsengisoli TaxID=363863 RepID=UPI0031D6605E